MKIAIGCDHGGYLLKQDILFYHAYPLDGPDDAECLTRSFFNYFEGREFTEIRTYLIVTQEAQRSQFVQYDPKKWLDFHAKVAKVDEAKEAGADYVGGMDLVERITKENWFDFDVVVASPDMMGIEGRLGKVLGPKGLLHAP